MDILSLVEYSKDINIAKIQKIGNLEKIKKWKNIPTCVFHARFTFANM